MTKEELQQEYIQQIAPSMLALLKATIAFSEQYPESAAAESLEETRAQVIEWENIVNETVDSN